MATEQVKIQVSAEDKASSILESITGSLGGFNTALLGITGAVAAVGLGLVKVSNDVAGFNKLIAKAGANVNASKDQLDQFRKVALDATRDTMFSAEQAAEALFQLAGGTISAQEAMNSLNEIITFATAAGFDSLKDATLAVSDMMVLFKLREDELARATDVMTRANQISFTTMEELISAMQQAGPAAAQAGIKFEEMIAILSALADTGFRGMEAGVGIKRALDQLAMTNVQEKLAEIGVSVLNAKGEFIGLIELLRQLEIHTQSMTGFEKQAFLADIFGLVAGPKMAALLNQGSEAVQKYANELNNAGGATQRTAAAVNEAINPVQQLSNRWFEFKTSIAPAVILVLESIIALIDNMGMVIDIWVTEFKRQFGEVKEFAEGLINTFSRIVQKASEVWSSVNNAFSGARSVLGFASGGIVPGPLGAPQLAVVHGGEQVIPASGLRSARGTNNIVVNISGNTISNDLDIRELADRVGNEIMRVLKSNIRI